MLVKCKEKISKIIRKHLLNKNNDMGLKEMLKHLLLLIKFSKERLDYKLSILFQKKIY